MLRRDPMAMLPFCGYNMGDYFAHWLKIGRTADPAKLPRIFYVNWFRKDADGKFVWPGFGENMRVLKWVIQRLSGDAEAAPTPIGNLPAPGSLDLDGLDLSQADLDLLLTVDTQAWKAEAEQIPAFFRTFGPQLPAGYSTSGTRTTSLHESNIPCTNSHDFSTNCALMNSVWSPSITSSSSRSYPSGDAPAPHAAL